MNTDIIKKIDPMASSQETMNWTKEVRKGGFTKRLTVEKVENGFIISVNKYGRDETKKDSEYIDEYKKFISETNPFEEEMSKSDDGTNESSDKKNDVKSMVESALGSMGIMGL